jgi:hypothetical protein
VFKVSEIAKQLIERRKDTASRIDVCIGSCGSALVEEKVKLATDLQTYRHPMSVHCDYSEDMNQEVTTEFIQLNNVKVVV